MRKLWSHDTKRINETVNISQGNRKRHPNKLLKRRKKNKKKHTK